MSPTGLHPAEYHQAARAFSYDPPASGDRLSTSADEAARAMSVPVHGGMVMHYEESRGGDGGQQMRNDPVPMEFSALGRQIVGGGPVQRVLGGYPFAEYLGGNDGNMGNPPPHPESMTAGGLLHSGQYPPPPPHPLVQFHGDPNHAEFVRHHTQMNPNYQHGNPPPGQWSEPQLCCGPGAPEHHHGPPSQSMTGPPPPRFAYTPDGSRVMVPPPTHPYYTPYSVGNGPPPGGVNMVRTVSANSSSSGYSDSEGYSYPSSQGSDFEANGACNPAYINDHHNLSSTPSAQSNPYYRDGDGSAGAYVYGSRNTGELHSMSGLRIDDGSGGMGYGFGVDPDGGATMRQRSLHRDQTVRGGMQAPGSASKPRGPTRTNARAIFHPSPQSMLAPHVVQEARRNGVRPGAFPGTNSPGLPTDDEFARMPTKRSRGRRPPCSPDLVLSNDPNANPSEAQIRYCGTRRPTAAPPGLSPDQQAEIREAFELFDMDKDGRIDYHELKVAMRALGFDLKKAEVLKILRDASTDSTYINFEQFHRTMERMILDRDPMDELRRAFKLFDEDNTGRISLKNLKKVARDLGESLGEDELQAMIDEFDLDGDNEISEQEFISIMADDA
ncbi:hypothetical protein P7C70_g7590, partial [Phenoliferia sp. Uapishka_3]